MNPQRIAGVFLALCFFLTSAFADTKDTKQTNIPAGKLTSEGRVAIIRGIEAEFVFARKPFPQGRKGLVVKDGKVSPDDSQLQMLMAGYGPALKPGDRAQITGIKFAHNHILFEINGGPVRKKKWYEHIEIDGMGGAVTPGNPAATDENANPRGSFVVLAFDKDVPNVSPDDVKKLLDPVLDFHSKSAAEAFLDTVPPKVKEAIKNHQVLVGMNRDMVNYAKGRPEKKIREKDGDIEYEEWIYGAPPQDVYFVRIVGEEVTRVETMKVNGDKLVKTEKEVDMKPQPTVTAQQQPGPAQTVDPGSPAPRPANAPSLRRPGEEMPSGDSKRGASSGPLPGQAPRPGEIPGDPSPTGGPANPNGGPQ